jgi:hypothetical protein
MTPAEVGSAARADDEGAVAGLVEGRWLRLAAAPSFAIMALLTVVLDNGLPNALCSVTGDLGFGGMAPMYLLMAAFHLPPWLNVISQRRNLPWQS